MAIKKRTLRVTEGVADVITGISVMVTAGEKKFYYIPYWFESTDNPNEFVAHHLDGELPEELIAALESLRELKEGTEPNKFLEN